MPDPFIQIGSTLPFSLQGPTNMGYNAPDPNALLNVINQITDPAPNLITVQDFLRLMKDQSNVYRTAIQAVLTLSVTNRNISKLINWI
jgi:hypothetical protein